MAGAASKSLREFRQKLTRCTMRLGVIRETRYDKNEIATRTDLGRRSKPRHPRVKKTKFPLS
jgi:hypothetical protein